MEKPLRVLIVEDSEDDALLLLRELRRGGYEPTFERVDTPVAMKAALEKQVWDIVVADYVMPLFSGLDALKLLQQSGIDLPFIIVSGKIGEDIAVEAMKAGAHDYVRKDNLARLIPAIEREMREVAVRRERKRAEEALWESEEKYRRFVETAREGIWVIDAKNNTTFLNKSMADMLGYTTDEMMGAPLFEFMDEEGREISTVNLERRRRGISELHEFRFRRKDGSSLWTLVNTNPLVDKEGRYAGAMAMITDITERKQAEEKIIRLNRLYSVLSDINQAIVHIRDRQKLLDEACRIAVEKGLFRMAWIGIVAPDTLRVHPVAQNGFMEGYLDNILISIRDVPEDTGINSTAIRDGKHFICNDIENDPYTVSWRDEALKRGYRSLAAFPLQVGWRVIGAFNVYAPEPHFFDNEEIRLLDELAADISFALESMEQENRRKRAEEARRLIEEKYRSVVESTEDSMYMVDMDCNYLFMNTKHIVRLGLSKDRYLGRKYSEFHQAEDAKKFAENIKHVFEIRSSIQYEYPQDTKWFLRTLNPIKDIKTGKVTAVTVVSKEITEHKKAEEVQKEKARSELNSFIVSALPVFASGISVKARDALISSFAERFEKNVRHVFEEEMERAGCGPKAGVPRDSRANIDCYMSWITEILYNIGIQNKTEFTKTGGRIEFQNCTWTTEAESNPIFCLMCRSMMMRSFTWTMLRGDVIQKSSIAGGSKTCVFDINVR